MSKVVTAMEILRLSLRKFIDCSNKGESSYLQILERSKKLHICKNPSKDAVS